MSEAAPLPLSDYGIPTFLRQPDVINLGAGHNGGVKRLATYAQILINSGKPIEPGPFCKWAARRISGIDKQDLIISLTGRRGSGKSYSAFWIALQVAKELARIMGGSPKDYFTLANTATLQDSSTIMGLLQTSKKYQIIIIDDASLAIGSRQWNSQDNQNWNALLTVCRTRRWMIILTSPLKSMMDVQTRDLVDFSIHVWKPFHAGGFNILKIFSTEKSYVGKNAEFSKRFAVGSKKPRYWVAFQPPKDLCDAYDVIRDQGASAINKRIVDTGSYRPVRKEEPTAVKRHLDELVKEKGESAKEILKDNPKISINALSLQLGLTHHRCGQLLAALGIAIRTQNSKEVTK